jgi:hypothetical protein
MENVRMKFYGSSNAEDHTIKVLCNAKNEICIEIDMEHDLSAWITLNKATAVQLVKKLKLEISKIEQI